MGEKEERGKERGEREGKGGEGKGGEGKGREGGETYAVLRADVPVPQHLLRDAQAPLVHAARGALALQVPPVPVDLAVRDLPGAQLRL